MPGAPAGAEVKLHYDTDREVDVGHVLYTRTGRGYLVVGARQQRRGKHAGRWHLTAIVLTNTELLAWYTEHGDESGMSHPLYWYKR